MSKEGTSLVEKIVSGKDHSLILTTDQKIYGWGDCESGKIGRMLKSRNRNKQALMIEKVHAKKATNIFCGSNHSFFVKQKNELYAWGLNNYGQLGIGHRENTAMPTLVRKLQGVELAQVGGGEHHSFALTKDGEVYLWGRNDEGQGGIGDVYGKWRREKAQAEYEKLMKEEEEKQLQNKQESQPET